MAGYQPTPEEIAAECTRIRDAWSPLERYRRQVGMPVDDGEEKTADSTSDLNMQRHAS